MSATPVVKWCGGKTKILPELLARMPAQFGRYYEPFAGGAAMFFRVAPERAVLGDANAELINAYHQIARNTDDVIELLQHHAASHCKDWYYQVRTDWNANAYATDPEALAAAFLYLNRTCFNGLWRVNRRGKFNVPMGDYADPLSCVADLIRAAAPALCRAEIRHGDYRETIRDASPGDLVYFDPPYDPLSETSNFTGYQAGRFDGEAQRQLAEVARDLRGRGVHVLLSNSDTSYVRSLYSDFQIDAVQVGRAINSKGDRRGKVGEVIMTSGYAVAREAA